MCKDNYQYIVNEWYDLQLKYNGYPGVLLDKAQSFLGKSSTVLNIGAGTGAFAIPIAREVKEVTVVEPSVEMLMHLCSKMNGLTNIRLVNQCWEDVTVEEIGMHDMVIAANSLYSIKDIAAALKKMLSVARKYLYIIMECRSNFHEGMTFMHAAPHLMIFPELAIIVSVLAFNFLGDGLRDVLFKS